jgi:hypothetical protein
LLVGLVKKVALYSSTGWGEARHSGHVVAVILIASIYNVVPAKAGTHAEPAISLG